MSQIHIWETTGLLRWFKARKLASMLAKHDMKENLHIVLPFNGVSVMTVNVDASVQNSSVITTT